jgi:hypothetical protein
MPIITTPLGRNDSGPRVAELHRALLKFGAPIAQIEKSAQHFGDSTLAAVLAFRNQYGLPAVVGNAAPFDASVGRLLNVAAAAADGNRSTLRIAVRESVAAASNATAREIYRLARRGFGRHLCSPARMYTAFPLS